MKKLLVQLIKGCRSRHKKLEEECCQTSDCVLEGVTFYVAYLGSCLVARPSGEETTQQAVNTIVAMAKKLDKKLDHVALTISLQGIRMVNCATGDTHLEFSIYRISYCSADATYDHIFNFIATNSNNTMECHAFLCKKRKIAQSATLTIAQAFNLAYSYWLAANEKRRRREKERKSRGIECSCDPRARSRGASSSRVSKTRDVVHCHQKSSSSKTETMSERKTSPISYSDSVLEPEQSYGAKKEEEERLLIDLRSPGQEEGPWSEIRIVDTDNYESVEPNSDDKLRDLSFTDIALRKVPAPILTQLPENASNLNIDSFVPTELTSQNIKLAGPSTPLHGSSLTNSTLCTPVGSPAVRIMTSQHSLTPRPGNRQHQRLKSPFQRPDMSSPHLLRKLQ